MEENYYFYVIYQKKMSASDWTEAHFSLLRKQSEDTAKEQLWNNAMMSTENMTGLLSIKRGLKME